MTDAEREALVEQGVTAFRDRDLKGRPVPPPAWWDLPVDALDELVRRQLVQRALERAADPEGRSATVRAVLARI